MATKTRVMTINCLKCPLFVSTNGFMIFGSLIQIPVVRTPAGERQRMLTGI